MPDEESDADEQSEEPEDEMAAQAKIDELQKELQYSKAETANARQEGSEIELKR